jgi:hypothetical protein
MRKARVALARRLAIIMHAMLRNETEFAPAHQSNRRPPELPLRSDVQGGSRRRRRLRCMRPTNDRLRFQPSPLHPAHPIKRRRARREHRHPATSKQARASPDPLENKIDPFCPAHGIETLARPRLSGIGVMPYLTLQKYKIIRSKSYD